MTHKPKTGKQNGAYKLYVYADPGAMKEHRFTDDVAITYARDKKEAIAKFIKLYDDDVTNDKVDEIHFNYYGVAILTDY